jgi:hypothetical protein
VSTVKAAKRLRPFLQRKSSRLVLSGDYSAHSAHLFGVVGAHGVVRQKTVQTKSSSSWALRRTAVCSAMTTSRQDLLTMATCVPTVLAPIVTRQTSRRCASPGNAGALHHPSTQSGPAWQSNIKKRVHYTLSAMVFLLQYVCSSCSNSLTP